MATVKIWPVNHHLPRCIAYIMNPQKTVWKGRPLVSGIRLDVSSPTAAARGMNDTKQYYGKTGGRLAYHAEQSFKPGEVTPEVAHEIGKKFAQEAWGDRFEVVVTTHVDKSHLHNHFTVNSVSCVDGKKYQEGPKEYARLQEISDRLCREYGLSVVQKPERKRAYKAYPELHPEERKPPTVHTLICQDMDNALQMAHDLDSFYARLRDMGYRVKRNGAHPAISPPGHGYFRLYRFAPGYTEEDIVRRLEERNRGVERPDFLKPGPGPETRDSRKPSPERSPERPGFSPDSERKYYTWDGQWVTFRRVVFFRRRYTHCLLRRHPRRGLRGAWLQFRFILKCVEDRTYPGYPPMDLRRELYRLRQVSDETLLLVNHKIDTQEELQSHMGTLEESIREINRARKRVRQQIRHAAAPEERDALREELQKLGDRCRPLYKERALCRDIAQRSGMVMDMLERERENARAMEEQALHSQEKGENAHEYDIGRH